jgi:thiol-disulfide isomerase/thioredoxin
VTERIRRPLLLSGLLLPALLMGFACGAGARFALPRQDERLRPDLSEPLRRLEGGSTSLAASRGKVVLVNYFSTDCLPCLDEVPRLVRIHRELEGRGFSVVGIALDLQGALTVSLFQERYGISYLLLLASPATLRGEIPFGRLPALPTSVLLDREGAVAAFVIGVLDEERLRAAVAELLKE